MVKLFCEKLFTLSITIQNRSNYVCILLLKSCGGTETLKTSDGKTVEPEVNAPESEAKDAFRNLGKTLYKKNSDLFFCQKASRIGLAHKDGEFTISVSKKGSEFFLKYAALDESEPFLSNNVAHYLRIYDKYSGTD